MKTKNYLKILIIAVLAVMLCLLSACGDVSDGVVNDTDGIIEDTQQSPSVTKGDDANSNTADKQQGTTDTPETSDNPKLEKETPTGNDGPAAPEGTPVVIRPSSYGNLKVN